MTDAYKVSNSEIQSFKDCRRKWYLNYYRHLVPTKKKWTGPLPLGTRVHAALDDYYSLGTPLLDAYALHFAADQDQAEIDGTPAEELESEGELGRIMLEGYLDWVADEGIDADYEMISTEQELSVPMLDGEVELRGKLDMRVRRRSDGVRLLRDFKTVGGSFQQWNATAHLNEQVLTYMLLEHAQNTETDNRIEGAVFTLLKKVRRTAKANPPFYDQIIVRHNVFSLRSFWDRIHGTLTDLMGVKKALDAGANPNQVAYPRPSSDCTWKCPFFSVCPLIDDGSAAEAAITDQFTVGDPNARYEEKKGNA